MRHGFKWCPNWCRFFELWLSSWGRGPLHLKAWWPSPYFGKLYAQHSALVVCCLRMCLRLPATVLLPCSLVPCLQLASSPFLCRYDTPLVADIHFSPLVASMVADCFEKIRVNPGNFVDGRKKFDEKVYDDDRQFLMEQEQIREVRLCWVALPSWCQHSCWREAAGLRGCGDEDMQCWGCRVVGQVANCRVWRPRFSHAFSCCLCVLSLLTKVLSSAKT